MNNSVLILFIIKVVFSTKNYQQCYELNGEKVKFVCNM